MRILLTTEQYKPRTNGVTNVVLGLKQELQALGHDARVLTLAPDGQSRRDGDEYYIRSVPAPSYPGIRLSPVRRDPLLDELREWGPDIVHSHTEFSTARMGRDVVAGREVPLVMTVHTDYQQFVFGSHGRAWPVRMVHGAWSGVAYRDARALIAPSDKAAAIARTCRVDCPVVTIPNGIELDRYRGQMSAADREELMGRLSLADNHKVLVSVCRVSREKRVRDLVTYMPELLEREPQAQLLIVGGGPDLDHLMKLRERLGLSESVRFTGMVGMEDVWRYYALGDVFVSSSDFEMHSLTYLEAMAAGLPLVCREDPCLEGVLEQGVNGYSFTSPAEYVERVTELLDDDALRGRMAQASAERAEDFTVRRNAERTLDLYERVLSGEL
jgi:1,2-diacylglycerol 3-alpha-glucosyltransferase